MFCSNCGAEITGNFCSNCGAPARPAVPRPADAPRPVEKVYPVPPLGRYEEGSCTVTVKPESIVFEKSKSYHIPVQEILYSDIAYVYLVSLGLIEKYICLRTKDTIYLPFPEEARSKKFMKDPLCIQVDSEVVNRIYQFLNIVAGINAYDVPVKMTPPTPSSDTSELTSGGSIRDSRNTVRCPKCGSTSISAGRRGFSVGRALLGGMIAPGVGVVAGAAGSNKMIVTCLNCGHSWKI